MANYIQSAEFALDRAEETERSDYAMLKTQMAIASALIAIAQELHNINERAELEAERQEVLSDIEFRKQSYLAQ